MMDDFFDLSARVGAGYAVRPLTQIDGIGVHHTVSGGHFIGIEDPWLTPLNEMAHVLMIDQYHASKGWGGIGYSALVFASGRVYWMGPLTQQRAGIGGQNWHIASWAFAADLTTRCPTPAAIEAAGRVCRRIMDDVSRWDLPVRGHRDWVTDPAFATSCPGPLMDVWMPDIMAALGKQGDEMLTVQDMAWVIVNTSTASHPRLVKGTAPTVYLVTPEGKKPFPGIAPDFVTVGFRWDDIIAVSDAVLNAIPNHP